MAGGPTSHAFWRSVPILRSFSGHLKESSSGEDDEIVIRDQEHLERFQEKVLVSDGALESEGGGGWVARGASCLSQVNLDGKVDVDFETSMILVKLGMVWIRHVLQPSVDGSKDDEPCSEVETQAVRDGLTPTRVRWDFDKSEHHTQAYHCVVVPRANGIICFEQVRKHKISVTKSPDISAPWVHGDVQSPKKKASLHHVKSDVDIHFSRD